MRSIDEKLFGDGSSEYFEVKPNQNKQGGPDVTHMERIFVNGEKYNSFTVRRSARSIFSWTVGPRPTP